MWSLCKSVSVLSFLDRLAVIAFLILLKNIATTGNHVDTHRLAKRMDLESCLEQFDIHRDTIIRTEESQAIGGKFIQGLALETLEECQRLCCETESCDVYIFEDKGEGYCYLFECGPPENFRCKFTRHANYTSAVLTPIQHMTPPPTPTVKLPAPYFPRVVSPSLTQHERELTNLKQKIDSNVQQEKTTTTTTQVPIAPRASDQVTTTKSSQQSNSSCGRFQFQCHSGECIAVYNACDGIPQCEDGSDEGQECPTISMIGNKPRLPKTMAGSENIQIPAESSQSSNKQLPPSNLGRQYSQSGLSVPVLNNRVESMSALPSWPNRKIQDLQPDIERSSRIFNHKGGLQIPANNLASPYSNPNSGMYSPIQREMYYPADVQTVYRNIVPQGLPPGISWKPQQLSAQSQPIVPANSYVISVNGEPVPQVPPISPVVVQQGVNNLENVHTTPSKPQESPIIPVSPAPSPVQKSNLEEKNHQKKGHRASSEESEEYSEYGEKSTEAPKKKQRKHKKISKDTKTKSTAEQHDNPAHEQYKMIKEELEMEFVDHDGQSERPGGAVLSLTLGVIVSAALAILVGCRMRTIGRRVRRLGKAPYAHDADFLVNGMYL